MSHQKLTAITKKLAAKKDEVEFRTTGIDGLWAVGTKDDYHPMTTDEAQKVFEKLGMTN